MIKEVRKGDKRDKNSKNWQEKEMKIARERKEGRISQIRDQEIRESY